MAARAELGEYARACLARMREEAEKLTDPVVQESVTRILDEFADAVARITGQPKTHEPFVCPICHRVSYNPTDAFERYCGACHRFFTK